MLAVKLTIEITLLVVLGWFLGKINMFSDRFEGDLSRFVIDAALPCLIIVSMNKPFDPAETRGLITLMLLSLGLTAAFFALGQIGYLAVGRGASGRLLRFGTAFCNYTYFGMPVMETLFGAEGLFLYSIFTVPIRLVIYFFARLNFSGETGVKNLKDLLRLAVTPPTLAVAVGLTLYLLNIQLPEVLYKTMDSVGDTSSPLGMILVGMNLSHIRFKDIFRFPKAFITVGLRSFAAPIIALTALYFTNLDTMYIKMSVIYASLPVAAITTSYIINYEKDDNAAHESAVAVLVSTLLSIITLPLTVWILERIYG